MPDEATDQTRIDPRLTRIGLLALAAISDKVGVDFFDADIDGKKAFLTKYGKDVIEVAKTQGGELGRYFENRVVVMIENQGNAGLYFIKKPYHG